MANIVQLLTEHIDIWTAADTAKKSGRGRASGNAGSVYGVKKLRELILELAVRGKLVQQDPNDEPASELLKRIQTEKAKLKKEKPLALISDAEKPFGLPIGWEWVYFGEVAQHNSGKTLDKGRNTGVLRDYITTSNLYWGTFELDSVRQMPIEESELERCTAIKGDLLLCEGGEAGRAAVWELDKDVCFQNHIHRARLYGKISPYYAYRYFEKLNASGEIEQYRKGVGISNMSGKALASVVFALPPLAEQQRIVAKVDELMALCDQLEQQHSNAQEAHEALVSQLLATLTQSQNSAEFNANWQRIYAHFDVLFTTEASIDALKQILLQLAVMGKLAAQDPNDEPASELLKRIQAEKAKLIAEGKLKKEKSLAPIGDDEKPFELPKGWEWSKVLDCCVFVTDGEHATPQRTNDGKIPLVTAKNVRDGYMDYEDTDFVDISVAEKCWKRCKPEQSDLLMVSVGATLGRLTILGEARDMVIVRSVTLIRPCLLSPLYLSLAIKSPLVQAAIWGSVRQMAQPGLYLAQSSNLVIPIAPLAEQHRIVAKVDALMALCDQLKTRIQQAQQQQQAIADALVAQAVA